MLSTLQNTFTLQGRLNRVGFLLSFIAMMALSFFFFYLNGWFLNGFGIEGETYLINKSIFGIILLAIWTPFIVKRLHDLGLSGWWVLVVWAANPLELRNILLMQMLFGIEVDILSVPMVVLEILLLFVALGLFVMPENDGENRWGSPNNRLQIDAATPRD